jgi:hypothetical protein
LFTQANIDRNRRLNCIKYLLSLQSKHQGKETLTSKVVLLLKNPLRWHLSKILPYLLLSCP